MGGERWQKLWNGIQRLKELHVEKCSHDVASNNMVVIFAKAEDQLNIWLEDENGDGSGKVLASREVNMALFAADGDSDDRSKDIETEEDKSKDKSSRDTPLPSAANILEDEIRKVSGKIDELKFQSAEFIYELD